MMKRFTLLMFLLCVVGFAGNSIVQIGLDQDRLKPLFNRGLSILAELDHNALVLIEGSDLDRIGDLDPVVLVKEPKPGELYLIYPVRSTVALEHYGTVLLNDGNAYLMQLLPGMLEGLMREPVMIRRLPMSPMVRPVTAAPGQVLVNPIIQDIVANVNPDTILALNRRMQQFRTRYSTTDSCDAAALWIANRLLQYGCDTVYLQPHTSGHAPNVVGVKRGIMHPDNIYVVIDGHFDSYSPQASTLAPGADDNSSGTMAGVEAARVMKDYVFEYSVRYLAFSGEEFGLYGSEYYAQQARNQGDSILGVINGDMIAYTDHLPESLEVITNTANVPFADFFVACADTYTTIICDRHTASSIPSDIQPFYDQGYHGLCTIEDYMPTNPHYHQTSDSIGAGYNNNAFCTEATKAEIAALCVLARPAVNVFLKTINIRVDDPGPGGNNNGLWESGEAVNLIVPINNIGMDTANNAVAVLSTGDSYVTINTGTVNLGDILPRDTVDAVFRATAAAGTPAMHLVDFNVHLTCTGGSWDDSRSVYINPLPDLVYQNYAITGGNGNGILDPGETANLVVTVKNSGFAPAGNVTSVLRESSSFLTLVDSSGNYGTIAMGDTANNLADPYILTAASGTPIGTVIPLLVRAVSGTYVDTFTFPITVGRLMPTDTGYYYTYWSHGPYQQAPVYSWYAIDSTQTLHPGTSLNHGDDATTTVTIPFTFRFYGVAYTQASICSNGWVALGSETSTAYTNYGLPSTSSVAKAVFGIWDDLNPGAAGPGNDYYYYDATNHRFVVEWFRVEHYGGGSTTQENFEILLYDPAYYPTPTNDGEIIVQYRNAMREADNTVGIQNSGRTVGIQYYFDGTYHTLGVPITDTFAVKFTPIAPTVGVVEETNLSQSLAKSRLAVYPTVGRSRITIAYTLGNRVQGAGISIYDITGRLVKSIALDHNGLHANEIIWQGDDDQGRNVAAGVYFVKLTADETEVVEKAVLLR